MKVVCIKAHAELKLGETYTATESIYSDYYDLQEVKGWTFKKDIFRGIERG